MVFHSSSNHAAVRRTFVLAIAAVLAGLFLINPLGAQTVTPVPIEGSDVPFTDSFGAIFGGRDMAFRLNYDTERYGQQNGQFGIGLQGHRSINRGVWLFSGQYNLDFGHSDQMGVDVGGGLRILHPGLLGGGETRIFGAQLWYDGFKSDIDNYFNQIGFSLESLGDRWDFRLNGNFPLGDTTQSGTPVPFWGTNGSPVLGYTGSYLTQAANVLIDEAMSVIDFEGAGRIANYDAWVFLGGYGLDASSDECFGGKVGARGWLGNDAMMQLALTQDDFFDTTVTFSVVWYPGRTPRSQRHDRSLDDRLRDPVIRNDYIATRRIHEQGNLVLHDMNGDAVRVIHVNNPDGTSPESGDGTYENPYTSLDLLSGQTGGQDNTRKGDIILVWSGSEYNGQSAVLKDLQRLLGEGNNVRHTVMTEKYGALVLPETRAGAASGAMPQIHNAPGAAVTLGTASTTLGPSGTSYNSSTGRYSPIAALSENEVSNLSIDGGTQAIVSSAVGIGEANINRVAIADTTGNGIELKPFELTYIDGSGSTLQRATYFSPTVNNATFSGVGGDDVNLDATTTVPSTAQVTESIQIANVASNDGDGWGIHVIQNKKTTAISQYAYNGGTTAAGGIRFEVAPDTAGGATINECIITGGSSDADKGYGVSLVGATADTAASTFTLTNTEIINTRGSAFHVDSGMTDVNFTGLITQSATDAGTAVEVEGQHTGEITFAKIGTNQTVITASNGNGLQFDNADGTYTFSDKIDLSGAVGSTGVDPRAGIDIRNGSDGSFTFSNAAITNIEGAGFNLNGGTAHVDFIGLIQQETNNAAAVTIGGGHAVGTGLGDGAVSFREYDSGAGAVQASTGGGLLFANADATYTFLHKITLSADAGVKITEDGGQGSEGTFTFTSGDSTISNTTGTAFTVENSEAIVAYTGTIANTAAGNGQPVEINANTGGKVTFNGTITSGNSAGPIAGQGISITNNTGGEFEFKQSVNLNTEDNTGVILLSNNGAIIRLDNLQINTTSGTGILASGGGTLVGTGAASTITTLTGRALNLNGMEIDADGLNFDSVSTDGAVNGILLNNIAGAGALTVNGGAIQNTTSHGISITDAVNVSLNNMTVTGTGGDGIYVYQGQDTTTEDMSYTAKITACDVTTTGTNKGVNLIVGDGVTTSNLTVKNCENLNAGNAEAVLLTVQSGTRAKTINFLMNENGMLNNSATLATANLNVNGSGAALTTTVNATVHDNTFANSGAGGEYLTTANTGEPTLRLSLLDNDAGAAGTYDLVRATGSFSLEKLTTVAPDPDVHARNVGTINVGAGITNDSGDIPTPPQ